MVRTHIEYTITAEDEARARRHRLRPARRGPTASPTPEAVAAREAADAARLVSPRDAAIARLPANIDPASAAGIALTDFLEEQSWPEAHTEYPVYLHGRSVTEHETMLEESIVRLAARNAAADAPLVEEGQLEDDDEEEELDERDTAIQELHASLQAREDTLAAVQARLTALEASHAAVTAGMVGEDLVTDLDQAYDKLMNFELQRMTSGVTLQTYITEFRNTITMCGAGCMNRALTVATFQRGLTPQLRGAVAKDLRSLPHPTLEDAVYAAIENHKANVASAGANVTPSKRGAGHAAAVRPQISAIRAVVTPVSAYRPGRTGGAGGAGTSRSHGAAALPPAPVIWCFHCGVTGHKTPDCPDGHLTQEEAMRKNGNTGMFLALQSANEKLRSASGNKRPRPPPPGDNGGSAPGPNQNRNGPGGRGGRSGKGGAGRNGGRGAVMAEGSASASPGTPSDQDNPHIPAAIKAELQTLLHEYSDVFKPLTDTPPERPVGHTIPLVPDARPPVTPMYRLSKPEQEELKRQIQDYLSKGMIEPSSSPYAAPILIDDLFDRLSGCSVFSSLDLQAGYHQIRITPEDVPKTAFRTPEGHFQFKVLSFGLTNAPATFQRVMNDAFAPVLGKCALVYLDDILVMSKSQPEHLQHLRLVFDLLRKNKLYAKMSKCEFMQLTLRFLGHVISAGAISVDPDKVRAIVDWPVPSSLTQLQSFLGAANFVRKFVQGFSAISAPLTDLCGKLSATFPWHSWPDHERLAFYELKAAMANVPMLRLPDHTQPFQVYCDASLQGVGAVLMQDGYPLAYLSKKLSSAEVNYTTGYRLDPAFNAEADLSSMYQDTHGLWRLTSKDKVVVPNDSELRNHILHEMHDAVYSGHVGISKTLERVSRVFWWNTMRADVRYYVSTCDACQRDKASTLKPGGLLNPLSIPEYRWESVSMDFITKLPSGSHGYDAICVFVDRLSKMVHFVPCCEDLKARRFAQLFIDHVYKLHGMPAELISDRGSLFTSVFWREVMRRCGSKPALSSSYHPQSDGQTERYNRVLEEMLRHYISPTQSDWPDYLALAEFAVNNSWQESIQSTPFLVNTAQSRQAAYANKARRDVEYKVGQKVLLSTKNLKLQPGKARKLIPRYVGPFEILLLVGAVAVKLDLPASMSRLHPVFHVSLIKPYTGTDVGFMPPPVTWMDETPVYYVERLLDHKGVKDNKASFYLVQWEGYDSTHNTWEPRSNLTDCDKVLAEYNAIHHLK
ncbi:hypothetical protein QJQ45_012570 [Haematococcus lacustris]|nr:hypothetical protein QJQ45_012570 [Haematococcus lacustris]